MSPSEYGYVLGEPEDVKNWGDPTRTKGGQYVLLTLQQAKSRLVSGLRDAIDSGVDISLDGQAVMEKVARLLAENGSPVPGLRPKRKR